MSLAIIPIRKKVALVAISIAIVTSVFFVFLTITKNQSQVHAATRADWVAGDIISDTAFTDKDSMSVADIQAFLDSKISCDIWGTGIATELGSNQTRAQYAASRGWASPPYICLNKYYEVPKTTPGGNMPANNYANPSSIPSGAQSAAWIIKDAANRYNISPKVLLVKIATESVGPLTSDNWPLFSQYRYAMGSHCPDSGPGGSANCDTNYAGFSIQIYSAAELMRWYLDSMDQSWWTYKKPGVNYVLWNVTQRGCGGANVTIRGKATAALYTYTPYQPNDAALNNMYGTGDSCSAYGNRNFWRVYWDWFGNTRNPPKFVSFADPRKMTLIRDTQKINPSISVAIGDTFSAGLTRKFTGKIQLANGDSCYQTESDKKTKSSLCFLAKDLQELDITYEDIPANQQLMQVHQSAYKIDLRRDTTVSETYPDTRQITFTKKTVINNVTYYISKVDDENDEERGIASSSLQQSKNFEDITPILMKTVGDGAFKYNVASGLKSDGPYDEHLLLTYTSRVNVDGTWYYRTKNDASASLARAFKDTSLTSQIIEPFVQPRCMMTTKISPLINLYDQSKTGTSIQPGVVMNYSHKTVTSSLRAYQSKDDHDNNRPVGIESSNLLDTKCFEPFVQPRIMKLSRQTVKINPYTGTKDVMLPLGMERKFTSKILIGNTWYYRTEADTTGNRALAIPAIYLRDI